MHILRERNVDGSYTLESFLIFTLYPLVKYFYRNIMAAACVTQWYPLIYFLT